MTNQALHIPESTPITMLELPAHVCGGMKTLSGEVYRGGPYLVRAQIGYWAESPEKLETFLGYLAGSMHYQVYGHLEDCPGSFRGNIAVPRPSGSRAFSSGWYTVHMWVEDNLLFHADKSLKPGSLAVKLLRPRLEEALSSLCCVDADSEIAEVKVTEASGSWLSYQLGKSTLGTPVGTAARFVGPNLYRVEFARTAVVEALDLEASASVS